MCVREASLEELVRHARDATAPGGEAATFRAHLRRCHIELQKDLWALDDATGKAYELGNGLSDTYGRICCAYRQDGTCVTTTWKTVFGTSRIEGIKRLLDDLQSRLDANAVTVVRMQLDSWCAAVPDRVEALRSPPNLRLVREQVRRQTIIWRQLLAGDKEPEAYLDRDARAELRDELRSMIWRRYWRWLPLLGAVLFILVVFLPNLIELYESGMVETGLASVLVAGAGALGITRACVLLTIRGRIDEWSQLLWDRAVAQKVADATMTLHHVLPPAGARRFRTPLRARASAHPPTAGARGASTRRPNGAVPGAEGVAS